MMYSSLVIPDLSPIYSMTLLGDLPLNVILKISPLSTAPPE